MEEGDEKVSSPRRWVDGSLLEFELAIKVLTDPSRWCLGGMTYMDPVAMHTYFFEPTKGR